MGLAHPDWTPVTARRSAPDELSRYLRDEFGDSNAGLLRVRHSQKRVARGSRSRAPGVQLTIFERLARVVASFF